MAKAICSVFVALIGVVIVGCDNGQEDKGKSSSVQQAAKAVEHDQVLFEYLEKLSQDEIQRLKYLNTMEKLSRLVSAEAKKNPVGMSSFIEEIIPLISKAGPGAALQAEEYASEAVREEMRRLRQDSNIENLVKKEKQVSDLQKTIGQLEKVIEDQKKEIAHLQEIMELKSKKVPVLLINRWLYTNCSFMIESKKTGDQWEYLLQDSDSLVSQKEIMLLPGDYTVKFCSPFRLENSSMFTVELEATEHDGMKKHYHAVVESVR